MKIRIPSTNQFGYTFDASEGKVYLTGMDRFNQVFGARVRNVTDDVELNVSSAELVDGVWVLSLTTDTTAMSDSDELSLVVSVDDMEAIFHALQGPQRPYGGTGAGLVGVGTVDVTPNNSADVAGGPGYPVAFTGGGDISVVWLDGSEDVITVDRGQIIPILCRRVKATGTTATGIKLVK